MKNKKQQQSTHIAFLFLNCPFQYWISYRNGIHYVFWSDRASYFIQCHNFKIKMAYTKRWAEMISAPYFRNGINTGYMQNSQTTEWKTGNDVEHQYMHVHRIRLPPFFLRCYLFCLSPVLLTQPMPFVSLLMKCSEYWAMFTTTRAHEWRQSHAYVSLGRCWHTNMSTDETCQTR